MRRTVAVETTPHNNGRIVFLLARLCRWKAHEFPLSKNSFVAFEEELWRTIAELGLCAHRVLIACAKRTRPRSMATNRTHPIITVTDKDHLKSQMNRDLWVFLNNTFVLTTWCRVLHNLIFIYTHLWFLQRPCLSNWTVQCISWEGICLSFFQWLCRPSQTTGLQSRQEEEKRRRKKKKSGERRSWPNLRYYPGILL